MKNELWYFLIDGQVNNETGIVGNFYSYGNHLGNALDKVFKAALTLDFHNSNVTEAELLESFETISEHENLEEIADDVFIRPPTYSFPLDNNDPDKDFIPPVGVVKTTEEGEFEYELIKESFVAYKSEDTNIFTFELVADKTKLIETYLQTISFLPSVDSLWIYILNYWDNDKTELWMGKHFVDRKNVIDFLKNNYSDTLENGFLDIVVHSIAGETNLTLDQHKKIKLHTKDEAVFKPFVLHIMDLGFEQTTELYSLEFGYHHWHYRPNKSLSREDFKILLEHEKFELIDKWEE